jgi:hypothetical protein
MAQDLPRFDVFGGYSYVHVSIPTSGTSGNITSNLNGGSGSVAFYPSRLWGVVGDFGGYKFSSLKQGSSSLDVSGSVVSYLFGPRIRFGAKAFTPFAQVLFGGAHTGDVTCSTSVPGCPSSGKFTSSENVFAMTAGGGVDVKVARHFSIRGQAEYFMTKFTDGVNDRQNNVRVSAGIVIH